METMFVVVAPRTKGIRKLNGTINDGWFFPKNFRGTFKVDRDCFASLEAAQVSAKAKLRKELDSAKRRVLSIRDCLEKESVAVHDLTYLSDM